MFGFVSYVHIGDHARNKLDAKSVKCTLLGYGEDEFGYKLWDDQNRKMIRSRDVVFNEKVMYNDRNTQVSKLEEPEYFGPNDVSENRVVEPVIQNDEEQGVPLQVVDPIPHRDVPTTKAQSTKRRSTRTPIPNRKYLQYMLLTDAGETECYDEAYQGEDASNWELAMKDEIKSLISNQTWELAKLPEGKKAL